MKDFYTFLKSIQRIALKQAAFIKKKRFSPNITHYLIILSFVCFGFILILAFQNCEPNNNQNPSSLSDSSETQEPTATTHLPQSSISQGHIIPVDVSGKQIIDEHVFPVNSDINLKLIHFHPDSNNFKWTVKRGFEFIRGSKTQVNNYQEQFSQLGAYDVSVISYQEQSPLTYASKRLIIGDVCEATDF